MFLMAFLEHMLIVLLVKIVYCICMYICSSILALL